MIVKKTLKNGTVKIYEYSNDKTKDYYKNYKEKNSYTQCDVCQSTVLSIHINKHKTTKKCQTHEQKVIKNI